MKHENDLGNIAPYESKDEKFDNWVTRGLIVIIWLLIISVLANAQEKTYNFQVAFAYTANQFEFNPNEFAEYINGYQVEFAGRVTGNKTRLWGFLNYERKSDVLQLPEYTYEDMVQRDTDALRFGAKLSHAFGAFEPYASAGVGFRKGNDVQPRKLERMYQAGGNVNLGHFFFRVGYQFVRVTGNEGTEQGYLFGGGFRF